MTRRNYSAGDLRSCTHPISSAGRGKIQSRRFADSKRICGAGHIMGMYRAMRSVLRSTNSGRNILAEVAPSSRACLKSVPPPVRKIMPSVPRYRKNEELVFWDWPALQSFVDIPRRGQRDGDLGKGRAEEKATPNRCHPEHVKVAWCEYVYRMCMYRMQLLFPDEHGWQPLGPFPFRLKLYGRRRPGSQRPAS
jgi:hypothetical protein